MATSCRAPTASAFRLTIRFSNGTRPNSGNYSGKRDPRAEVAFQPHLTKQLQLFLPRSTDAAEVGERFEIRAELEASLAESNEGDLIDADVALAERER